MVLVSRVSLAAWLLDWPVMVLVFSSVVVEFANNGEWSQIMKTVHGLVVGLVRCPVMVIVWITNVG